MPDYTWRAADAGGRIAEGTLEAASPAAAARTLRERGLVPVRIEAGAAPAPVALPPTGLARGAGRPQRGPVNQADVLAFTSELAIMLRAGLTLANALRVLIEMSAKPSVTELLQQVLDDVKGGVPLSQSVARRQAVFGDFYVNMVRAGEASGQLAAVLARLVEHMERLRALRESVVSATIYPAILLGVAVVSLIAMLGFVVPQFERLFTDLGDALPLPTLIVMRAGQLFRAWGVELGLVIAAVAWFVMRWLRTPGGRAAWQAGVLRLPLLGPLLLKFQLHLFARSLGTLLGNGVPLLAGLQIATQTVGNQVVRAALLPLTPAVKEGGRLVDAMRATGVFEPLAINLVRVGEETGRLGPMMIELAQALDREVETRIRRLLTLLEPALIIVLGLAIAGIIVSIMLGILSINDLAV